MKNNLLKRINFKGKYLFIKNFIVPKFIKEINVFDFKYRYCFLTFVL